MVKRLRLPSSNLKRNLNLPLITFYGLGNILGAGIYVLVGKVAGVAGMYTPLAFVVACIVASFTALSYAELSTRFPVSAGEAVYVQQGFGRKQLSIAVGLIVALSVAVSSATITRGFVGYLQVFIDLSPWIAISLLLLLLTSVAALGIRQAVSFAALLTVIEIFGLLFIIYIGGDALAEIPSRYVELLPDFSFASLVVIVAGGFLAFYAFLGFEDMVNVVEEVKDPQRNMPLGIILSLIVASLFYVLVALVAILNVSPLELAESNAPLALVYNTVTGQDPVLITIISLFAVVNGALIQIIMISRMLYGMSKQGWLPTLFSRVQEQTKTPVIATVFVGIVVWVFALLFPLVILAKITSFLVLLVFVFVNVSLIQVRRKAEGLNKNGRYPLWIPYAGAISSAGLIFFEVIHRG